MKFLLSPLEYIQGYFLILKSIGLKDFIIRFVCYKAIGLMVDIQKQIDYWINSADDDILTADLLIREK